MSWSSPCASAHCASAWLLRIPRDCGGRTGLRLLDNLYEPEIRPVEGLDQQHHSPRCAGRTRLGRVRPAADFGQSLLLTRAVLDQLLDLPLHGFEVEGGRVLHRRIVDGSERQLLDQL